MSFNIKILENLIAEIVNDISHKGISSKLKKREFNYLQAKQGIKLIIWGMFKKVVIADLLAPEVDNIFSNYNNFGAGSLWIGAIFFSFQIYCDFSGYSDIAIGISKLLGIEIMSNFKFPDLSLFFL